MSDKKEVLIKVEVLQALVNYLQVKPYHEVYKLINEIVNISKDKE